MDTLHPSQSGNNKGSRRLSVSKNEGDPGGHNRSCYKEAKNKQ